MGNRIGIIATYWSIFLNIALFAIKLWAGLVSGSIALIADAWHTLSDSISSLAVLIGLKVAAIPADETHPYGHGRAEIIASMVVGILLAVIGFNFLMESIIRLRAHEAVNYGTLAIVVTFISIFVKEGMAQYSIRIGKKTNSKALLADGWHHRSDAISSIVILVGIFVGSYYWWIDGVLGILVALLLFHATYTILKDTLSELLGEGISKEMEKDIRALAPQVSDINVKAHHFYLHHYGNHIELIFHIELPGEMSLHRAHEIGTKYENLIKKTMNIRATVHIDSK